MSLYKVLCVSDCSVITYDYIMSGQIDVLQKVILAPIFFHSQLQSRSEF